MSRRGLFLDRDGVINVDHGYVSTQERFEFIDGVFDLCKHASSLDYLLIVVTNQAGIGRGFFSEQDFGTLTEWMCGQFLARGTPLAKVYYCPYHPEHGVGKYKRDSTHRKPNPGMILQAAAEFDIDLGSSVLVGDRESDMQAGVAAGVGCNLIYVSTITASPLAAATVGTGIVSRLRDVMPFLCVHPARKVEGMTC